jgi:hypothetical protein
LRLGGRSLRLCRLLGLLVRVGIVRRTGAALEVFETALELLACEVLAGAVRAVDSRHTVVALSNAVLNAAALSKVRDLGPVLIGVGRGAEGTAGSRVLSGRWRSCRVGVGGL